MKRLIANLIISIRERSARAEASYKFLANCNDIVITNIITDSQTIPYNTNISRLDAEGIRELYK